MHAVNVTRIRNTTDFLCSGTDDGDIEDRQRGFCRQAKNHDTRVTMWCACFPCLYPRLRSSQTFRFCSMEDRNNLRGMVLRAKRWAAMIKKERWTERKRTARRDAVTRRPLIILCNMIWGLRFCRRTISLSLTCTFRQYRIVSNFFRERFTIKVA